ncbi:MAG: sugar ABC transporter ATP-binding protein [Myxococcales bacterium]|jgi:ribose transport system ATP-binding protein
MLQLDGVYKSFGGVKALRGVDLRVGTGEIVGIVGGNGAGKSTLMKVAAGVHQPDSGSITIDGRSPKGPADAIRLGVSLVRQELTQAHDLDVAANILLGHEPHRFGVIDRAELRRRAVAAIDRVGGGIDVRMRLGELSPGQRQRVEIARALSLNAKVVLLDEPTATLAESDAARLFVLLRQLREQGLGFAYISHRLGEIMSITDRIVCMRDGERVAEMRTQDSSREELVTFLAGSAGLIEAELPPVGDEVLLSVDGPVKFDVRAGEILGLAGLVGAGRTSVLRRLFGAKVSDLRVSVRGKAVDIRSPRDALGAGMVLVPEERASQGLFLDQAAERNIALPSLKRFVLEDEASIAAPFMQRFGIRKGAIASTLSGGNQQKIVLSKWLALQPSVLLLDEPTRGLDVKAKRDVHDVIREQSAAGKAIVVSSSEAEELASLCHRALVLARGGIRGELRSRDITDANILRLAT